MTEPEKPPRKLPDPKNVAKSLSRIARTGRKLVADVLGRSAKGEVAPPADGGVGKAFLELSQKMMASPGKLLEIQMAFWKDYLELWERTSRRMLGAEVEPVIDARAGRSALQGRGVGEERGLRLHQADRTCSRRDRSRRR